MKVRNMLSQKSNKEVANQFIILDGNKQIFQSYRSTMCIVEPKAFKDIVITLDNDFDNYTRTTRKYLKSFLANDELYQEISKTISKNNNLDNVSFSLNGYNVSFKNLNAVSF